MPSITETKGTLATIYLMFCKMYTDKYVHELQHPSPCYIGSSQTSSASGMELTSALSPD